MYRMCKTSWNHMSSNTTVYIMRPQDLAHLRNSGRYFCYNCDKPLQIGKKYVTKRSSRINGIKIRCYSCALRMGVTYK